MKRASVLAGNGTEGRKGASAKSSSFMQPTGLCSELESNPFVCNSQVGEISIIAELDGTCNFLSSIGRVYHSFGIHNKHQSMAPLPIQESEERLASVASDIKHTEDEVKALTVKNTPNGHDGVVASKTAALVQTTADSVTTLHKNIYLVNADFSVDLESCMTGQVEPLHATHHHKYEAGCSHH